MHMYETTTGNRRKSPGYTGLFAIVCLFGSIFLAWAVMGTSLVKTSPEMTSSPPVTTGMTSKAPVNSAAKP
jgi:hypothetical protein